MELKYYVPTKGVEYLHTHPALSSLVVSADNEHDRQGQPGSTPKNTEAKRFDLFGRKSCSVANHQVLFGHYDFNIWQSVAKFAELLPEEPKKEFLAILEEGRAVGQPSKQLRCGGLCGPVYGFSHFNEADILVAVIRLVSRGPAIHPGSPLSPCSGDPIQLW